MAQEIDELYRKEFMNTDRPIPGESLTSDPEMSTPWTSPPTFTKKTEALEHYFEFFTSEEIYDSLMSAIESGVPLIDIAKTILFQGFKEGLINPDMILLLAEPLVYMLAALAERVEIEFVIEEDREGEGEEDTTMLGQALGDIGEPERGEEFPEVVQEQLESKEPLNIPEGQSLLGAR